jgi:hypothetical protein
MTSAIDRVAGFCSGRPTKVRSEILLISTIEDPTLDVNCPVTKPATGVADDRTQRTRGMGLAVTDSDRPITPQKITAQQHSKTNVADRSAGRQSAGNPVTQTTNERPEISDHDFE